MTVIDDTLAEFGRSLGFATLELPPRGSKVLEIDSVGSLGLDHAGPQHDALVVSLSRPARQASDLEPRRLLALAHFRARPPVPLQVSALGDQIVLAAIIPAEELTLPRLHEVLQALQDHHRTLESLP